MHNARNRQAAKLRPAQAFPADVTIPPHRGASTRSVELPPLARPACPAPAKKRAAPKRRKKPAQRRRKAAAKPPVIALPQQSEPLAEPGIDLAAWLALPPPQPAAPLPRARVLAVQRGDSLLDALALWLGSRTRQLWRRLNRIELRQTARPGDEVLRLRAENERLRLQLEALLALQSGAGGSQAVSTA
jgi:hypothetical protein